MKYLIQFTIVLMVLLFSTLGAWYEGSALRDVPWEWKHTAFFSKILSSEITSSRDISHLDHFIYAAKFKPIFPILMALSLFYMVILSTCLIVGYNKRKLMVFHFCLGVMSLIVSAVISDSPTIGGKYFAAFFIISCLINFLLSFTFYFKIKNGNRETLEKFHGNKLL